MNNIVYIEGVGYCKEVTIQRFNNGVSEPYTIYEPINHEQSMIDYNRMEEEWEMDNYNEIYNHKSE